MVDYRLWVASLRSEFFSNDVGPSPASISLKEEISGLISGLEKVLILGLLQCLSSLLFTIFILPFKCLVRPSLSNYLRLAILLGVSTFLSNYLTVSTLYHDLKEQDFLKLNAVYNMIGVSDQLLMSFGHKSLKELATSTENFLIVLGYVCLHTIHQSLALTVFEVALNSSMSNLILIIVTASFVELKITVFKKTDKKVLTNVVYNDIIERLQLIIYLSTILCKAIITQKGNIEVISKGIFIVLMSSIIIDWVKHYFIVHYNVLSASVYKEIFENMKENWKKAYETGRFHDEAGCACGLDPACAIALSYRFTSLPQACMVLFK